MTGVPVRRGKLDTDTRRGGRLRWGDAAESQGMLRTVSIHRKLRERDCSFLRACRSNQPCQLLDFGPLTSCTVRESSPVVSSLPVCECYSSHRNLIQAPQSFFLVPSNLPSLNSLVPPLRVTSSPCPRLHGAWWWPVPVMHGSCSLILELRA